MGGFDAKVALVTGAMLRVDGGFKLGLRLPES